jgi:crossover junction endodeoxyribonuclease RuvC
VSRVRIVGVDPGLTGALALLQDGELTDVVDMPVLDRRVQAPEIVRLLQRWSPTVVVVEEINAMPRGSIASFSLGYSMGTLVAAVQTSSHPLARITPSEWKRIMRLTRDKNLSRRMATEMWPHKRDEFRLAKHDGRAEAALIAEAYRRRERL